MKSFFLLINALLIISIAFFCVQIFYKHMGKVFFEIEVPPQKKNATCQKNPGLKEKLLKKPI